MRLRDRLQLMVVGGRVTAVRVGIALVALSGFAFLILTARTTEPSTDPRVVWAARGLLVPLVGTAAALLRRREWGRWLGLGGALGVLPWAAVLSWGAPGYWKPALAIGLSATLFLALVGRPMYEAFEGRSQRLRWQAPGLTLVRWALIFNLASCLSLYMFAAAYRPAVMWHVAIPAAFLVVLVGGLWLLGLQKTVGLLLVGVGCVGLMPAGTYFVLQEMGALAEAVLFVVLLAPGCILGAALLVVFGGPILRQLMPR